MRLNQFGKSCLALILYLAAGAMPGFGEVLFDDLTDDLDPLEYRSLSSSGSIHFDDQGLSFNTNSPGGIEIRTDDGPLPSSDRWSIRAEFTVNRLTGLGLAGVGITGPDRWAAVLLADHDREYGVGQNFNPDKVKINGVDEDGVQLFGAPFAVQMDFTGDSLAGHFWRPDSATDITTIEYGRMLSSAPGPPRIASNGTDVTYRAIWLSESVLPLPTGFDGVADFDGNEIINANDIDLLAAQIEGDQDISFDLSLLSRFSGVVCELRATWWLGERGR